MSMTTLTEKEAKLHAYADVGYARKAVEELLRPLAEHMFCTSLAAEMDFYAFDDALKAYHQKVENLVRVAFHDDLLPSRVVKGKHPHHLTLVRG
jgi:hypothetical protein